jgi:hypothetical protein
MPLAKIHVAEGRYDQARIAKVSGATKTMSALAASSTVPALIEGPSSPTSPANDCGPRLFAIVAETPLFASNRAALEPRAPAPIIPIFIPCSY